jgi:hypothetical protein
VEINKKKIDKYIYVVYECNKRAGVVVAIVIFLFNYVFCCATRRCEIPLLKI